MNKFVLLCFTAMISPGTPAGGQEKHQPEVPQKVEDKNADPVSGIFSGTGTLFQSAADLRAASESLEQFGQSLEKTTANIGSTSEVVAEHMAQISSGFDPFGFQNAFKTIQQQTEVIRQQQEVIRRLQQDEIKRLKRENQQLKAGTRTDNKTLKGKKRAAKTK